ncbi:MAG: Rrf2 family transcriptional regulator [Myxococcota bacterium]
MVANSKLPVAIHVAVALGCHEDEFVTSEILATGIGTNPVVIRRIVGDLSRAGIVEARRGKCGGARLARPARDIPLVAIYRAIDGGGPFCMPKPGNAACYVARCMPGIVGDLLGDIDQAIADTLKRYTVADLIERVEHTTSATS